MTEVPVAKRNTLLQLFTSTEVRNRYLKWEEEARFAHKSVRITSDFWSHPRNSTRRWMSCVLSVASSHGGGMPTRSNPSLRAKNSCFIQSMAESFFYIQHFKRMTVRTCNSYCTATRTRHSSAFLAGLTSAFNRPNTLDCTRAVRAISHLRIQKKFWSPTIPLSPIVGTQGGRHQCPSLHLDHPENSGFIERTRAAGAS
jgi:hypothetical protein